MYNDSTPIGGKVSSSPAALIDAISKMPEEWALTPCVGKRNLWPKWNREPLDRQKLIEAIRSQKNHEGEKTTWTGVSIVTGPLSNGVMAIDFDGPLALTKYFELSGGVPAPATKRWTSGRPGHFQILLQVPPEKWERLQPKKIELENGEKLELRWNQCSTLPPSLHPDTGKPYIWKNDGAIAECPDFILDLMREAPAVASPQKLKPENTIYIDVENEKSLVEILENEILPRLDAEEFYGNWSALKPVGKELRGLCPLHEEKTGSFYVRPALKTFHCFGCGVGGGPVQFLHQIKGGSGSPTGQDFADVVRELAARVGVQMPDHRLKIQNPESSIQKAKTSNVLKHPAVYEAESPTEEIIDRVDRILGDELTPARQIISAASAARGAGLSLRDFRETLSERQAEQELDFSILDSISKFKQLHQIQNSPIDLREFFPLDIAKALLSKAESDRIDPVRILQSLLPVVGTMLGGRVGIVLKPGEEGDDDWVEYPIFYTADIGYPSTGKSATQDGLIRPLQKMQDAEQERLDEALTELVQLEEAWKELSKEQRAEKAESDENPRVFDEKYCKPKKWLLDESTAQALTKRIAEQKPMHGCLLLQDELSGLFESFDQFTGGKGGQRQFILKAWNKPLRGSVDRVDVKASYYFKNQTLSLSGTIQPDVARKIFNVASDPDGMLSRFLPAVAGIPPNFAKWSNVKVNLNRAMTELIRNLEQLPETLLTLPSPTAKLYESYWEKLRQGVTLNLEENPAYAYFLGKQLSYTGRFTIVLHCLENLGGGELPTRVTPETMNKAVRLSLFYCNQFRLLQSKSAERQPIEGILLDILKFVQQKGGIINTRQLCQSRFRRLEIEGKKFSAYHAKKFLKAIADAGHGKFDDKVFSTVTTPFVTVTQNVSACVQNVSACVQLKPTHDKDCEDLNSFCVQYTKKDISQNSDFTDESAVKVEENSQKSVEKDIHFSDLYTKTAETLVNTGKSCTQSVHKLYTSDTNCVERVENELAVAIANGPEAIQKMAAQYSLEVVQEAIARIKTKDPDAAEEIRDAIEVSPLTQILEKVPSQQEIQPPSTSRTTPAQRPSKTSPPPEAEFKAGDLVQVRADYITAELRGLQAVVVKHFDGDRYQIDFGRKIKTPEVEPKRFFFMDRRYFDHVTDGSQLEIPYSDRKATGAGGIGKTLS